MHSTPESCYKKNVPSNEVSKQQWLELDRKKSRKDYEQVTTNARDNGIKTVDWQEQKTRANQVLMEQTGMHWVDFGTLGDHQACRTNPVGSPRETAVRFDAASAPVQQETGADKLAGDFFGTSQSNGGVDDILNKAPSREAPSPPALTELRVATSRATACTDSVVAKPVLTSGSSSPTSSAHNTHSEPDSELQQHLEMALEYERRPVCLGAFPVSRNESAKSVAA
jgi:hypothetical protein